MKYQRTGGFLISKIHQLSGRLFTKKLKQYKLDEINQAQGRIMFPLWRKDGISIIELSKETALGKSTLTSMLDRLEESGLLRREHSKDDRRKILIFLTDEGKKLQEQYIDISQEMNNLFYDGFTEDEISDFENYLNRLLDTLNKHK